MTAAIPDPREDATGLGGRTVAVVSDGVLGAIVPLARQIRARRGRPVLITGSATDERETAWRELYDEIVVLPDIGSVESLAQAAVKAAGGGRPAGLFSCFDGLCLPAARAAARLGLPHPDLEGLARARDKAATRRALADHGVPSIRSAPIAGAPEVAEAARTVGFPAVFKPVDGTASHFVRKVRNVAELEGAFRDAEARLVDSWPALHRRETEGGAGRPRYLLEQYVEGDEYSLDVVVRDGRVRRIAAFDKFIVEPEGFLECAFATPFLRGDAAREERLWNYTEECLRALGVDNTLAHVEVLFTAEGPLLIEVNAGRPGGQILVRAVQDLVGVDLLAEMVALQTRLPVPDRAEPVIEGQLATYTVFPSGSGTVAALVGLDALRSHPAVVDILPFCAVGDRVDVEDKEFFALNVLTAGLDRERLVPFYDEIRATVGIELTAD
ncbi:ATP-grasp domain-containing protein [Streptomyces sp. 8N706]|uniref:ATP-grasp domain-containing protein n=1 Tax=Streptomyces sp. 8N706 TaxID=3457416 RepID=UPI003FD050C0